MRVHFVRDGTALVAKSDTTGSLTSYACYSITIDRLHLLRALSSNSLLRRIPSSHWLGTEHKLTKMAAVRTRHYDTLVLGAGMSGLACASRLYQHSQYRDGHKTLLVLEGRDRIGGRIESIHVNGCRLDTGANWIHGVGTEEKPNPLMGVLPHKRLRQLSRSIIFKAPPEAKPPFRSSDAEPNLDGWIKIDSIPRLQQFTTREGGGSDRVIPIDTAQRLMGSLWSMIDALHEVAEHTFEEEAKHITMLQAITKTEELRKAFQAVPQEYHRSLKAMPQFVENMEAAPLVAQSAEKSSDQPGMGLLEFALDDFDGDQVFLQDGYTALVEEVAQKLTQAGLIQLGVKVKRIDWGKNPIEVEATHGLYTAKQVVCSLPLGVLQHHSKEQASGTAPKPLFVPPLLQEKQTAIHSLGFGTLDKIMLIYEKPWWTEEPYVSIFEKGLFRQPFTTETATDKGEEGKEGNLTAPDTIMGFTEELPGIEIGDDGKLRAGLRVLSLINLDNLTDFPVLSAFVSCANAIQVEAMTDEQAGGIIHRALTSWLGVEPVKPVGVHVTRWATGEFSRGSYSHMIAGLSETKHREEFQRPVINSEGGVLRFAGEHTSRNHFATVHGALLSGWREADAILKED